METPESPERNHNLSSEWLQLIVDSSHDGIVTVDAFGRIIAFNPAAEKIFGYSRKEVIGHSVSEKLLPSELRGPFEKGLAGFIADGESSFIGSRMEIEAMRSGGKRFPAEIEIVSINPSKDHVFIIYVRDISEIKATAAERLQYADYIKRALVQTLLAVSKTVEIRDAYTAGHQRRVAHQPSLGR